MPKARRAQAIRVDRSWRFTPEKTMRFAALAGGVQVDGAYARAILHFGQHRSSWRVTCIMQVTDLPFHDAPQEPGESQLPDRALAGAGGGMVEHPDPARCTARLHALRGIPRKPRRR